MENKKVRLLIVDDNDHNLELVKRVLKDEGYELLFADNGKKALEVLAVIKIDLILLDVMMPGIDGFETCCAIKEKSDLVNIPIIFLTARTELNDIITGFKLGGVDYISKPFSKEELMARVRNHVQLKLMRDYLENEVECVRESRNEFMRLMLSFGKTLEDASLPDVQR